MLLKHSFSEEVGDLFVHVQSDLLIGTVILLIGLFLASVSSTVIYLVYKLGALLLGFNGFWLDTTWLS